MDKTNKSVLYLFLRYAFILFVGLFTSYFYNVLTPITSYLSYFFLNIFGDANFFLGLIIFNNFSIELVPACIAGSAYYLLLVLVFSVPNLTHLKRIEVLTFSFVVFLCFNVARIVFLALIANSFLFESLHLFFWYFISTLAVFLIWILNVKIFKINSIPVYSDFKSLINLTKK